MRQGSAFSSAHLLLTLTPPPLDSLCVIRPSDSTWRGYTYVRIFTIAAPYDALRLLKVLLPYCIDPAALAVSSPLSSPANAGASASASGSGVKSSSIVGKGVSPNVRLVALHVLAEALKSMPSSHLLPGM